MSSFTAFAPQSAPARVTLKALALAAIGAFALACMQPAHATPCPTNYGNQGNQGDYGNQGNQGDYGNQGNNCGHQTVPEPGTLALFAAGLLGCALFAARRRARQS